MTSTPNPAATHPDRIDLADRIDLGDMNDLQMVDKLLNLDGLTLIDAGCANGDTARELAARGATVLGVEPDPEQAERNRAAAPTPGVTLVEAGAEAMPAENNSQDGVFLFRSLHHLPFDLMGPALEEAARVLRPGGFLYVVEPGMDCSFSDMMLPFNDETEMRTRAQQALSQTAEKLLGRPEKYLHRQRPAYPDFETLIERFTNMSFNKINRQMIDQPIVRESFERGRSDKGYVFEQTMLVNIYRG